MDGPHWFSRQIIPIPGSEILVGPAPMPRLHDGVRISPTFEQDYSEPALQRRGSACRWSYPGGEAGAFGGRWSYLGGKMYVLGYFVIIVIGNCDEI